jgi:hypothetical protein
MLEYLDSREDFQASKNEFLEVAV